MENKIMKIPIDADLINEVLNYLSKRPFGEVNNLINVQVVHLDELSQITEATFEKRKKYIPNA